MTEGERAKPNASQTPPVRRIQVDKPGMNAT